MIILFFTLIFSIWALTLGGLWLWKKKLFVSTWNEPYFRDTPILIESDDWGPGGDFHAQRLNTLLATLDKHRDSVNRTAILTANIVLCVPDLQKIDAAPKMFFRKSLSEHFPKIFQAMQDGMRSGTFVPQLHGLEHLNGRSFATLWHKRDPRMPISEMANNWWNWETLESPLQGHYVDGAQLPTTPIDRNESADIIKTATSIFEQTFGYPSTTTVAPCYLWNDDIEKDWHKQQITAIQTAGYRCIGRNADGKYIQNPAIIRTGEKNQFNQIYLVRNVMFEPVDGSHTVESAFEEAKAARRQALPVSISTHRYNFTRSEDECTRAINDLDQVLTLIRLNFSNVRFIASPELCDFLHYPQKSIFNHFNQTEWPSLQLMSNYEKIVSFLYRLYYRHFKLVLLSYLTGLFIPLGMLMIIFSKNTRFSQHACG